MRSYLSSTALILRENGSFERLARPVAAVMKATMSLTQRCPLMVL